MNDTDIEICYLSASDTLKKYKEKKLSPVEVLSAVIKRIETVNPVSYTHLTLPTKRSV